jgi:hypothetical protein
MAKLAEPVRIEHGQVASLHTYFGGVVPSRISWASLATWRGPNQVLIGVQYSPINLNDLMVAQRI